MLAGAAHLQTADLKSDQLLLMPALLCSVLGVFMVGSLLLSCMHMEGAGSPTWNHAARYKLHLLLTTVGLTERAFFPVLTTALCCKNFQQKLHNSLCNIKLSITGLFTKKDFHLAVLQI